LSRQGPKVPFDPLSSTTIVKAKRFRFADFGSFQAQRSGTAAVAGRVGPEVAIRRRRALRDA
jgi:hypothetical protein